MQSESLTMNFDVVRKEKGIHEQFKTAAHLFEFKGG